MRNRWTRDEAWEWYNKQPFLNGCNFVPSKVKQGDFYRPETHEESYKNIEVEVKMAAELGLNSFRLIERQLPSFEQWSENRDLVMGYFDEYLDLLDRYGISCMPLLATDCLSTKPDGKNRTVSCFDGEEMVGWRPDDDQTKWELYEPYFRDFARRYKNDRRIIIWNLWNEAGNSHRDVELESLPFIARLFYIFREEEVSQPLTADCWGLYKQVNSRYSFELGLSAIERAVCSFSDIITFHYYGDLVHTKKYMQYLQNEFGRPLINTEWGHRPWGSFIPAILPMFKKYNVGSYFFGFVNGRYSDFRKVWGFLRNDTTIDTSLWMHGIYDADYSVYDQDDIDTLLELKEVLKKEKAEREKKGTAKKAAEEA